MWYAKQFHARRAAASASRIRVEIDLDTRSVSGEVTMPGRRVSFSGEYAAPAPTTYRVACDARVRDAADPAGPRRIRGADIRRLQRQIRGAK